MTRKSEDAQTVYYERREEDRVRTAERHASRARKNAWGFGA